MSKVAVVSGITSQDAKYLVPILLKNGYEVYGLIRRSANNNLDFLKEAPFVGIKTIEWDILDSNSIYEVINKTKPDEFYNLSAMSNISTSFHQPDYTIQVNGVGVVKILEELRKHSPHTKFLQCGTSAQFGASPDLPRNESVAFQPNSPYAISKCLAFYSVKHYRDAFNMYCVNLIMENHDSPSRPEQFLSRKVSKYVANFYVGKASKAPLAIGNLSAEKDWGHAKDFALAMYQSMQMEFADDFCLGTGIQHTVRDLIEIAFKHIDVTIVWRGCDKEEKGYDCETGDLLVTIDPQYYRPNDSKASVTDYRKARQQFGWVPTIKFEQMIDEMVANDIKIVLNKGISNHVHT